MCVVIQGLDASNWRWGSDQIKFVWNGNAAMYLHTNCRNLIRVASGNERITNVHCGDNHADESCTISMIKRIIKTYGLSKAIHTNVASRCADIADSQCGKTGEKGK